MRVARLQGLPYRRGQDADGYRALLFSAWQEGEAMRSLLSDWQYAALASPPTAPARHPREHLSSTYGARA